MGRAVLALCAVLAVCGGVASCKSSGSEEPPTSYIQQSDVRSNNANFDPTNVIDDTSFQDSHALSSNPQSFDSTKIQDFLNQTPYGYASFLSTYQSNGIVAADAIAFAAYTYGINPIVLLVRAEADQGLISQPSFPSPESRVDYAFGCGCASSSSCDPALSGFDLQVECLAKTYRTSLDEIQQNGQTASGWGTQQARTTIDSVRLTPKDASTAALYSYTPKVGVGESGGTWLFWQIYQHYASVK